MNEIVDAIYKTHEDREAGAKPRSYLGGSMIGHDCDRYIWMNWRHAFREEFGGRMLRLFQRGHREEDAFIAELIDGGIDVYQFNEDGSQFSVETLDGHLRGHLDGVAKNIPGHGDQPHLLEFKTSSKKMFEKLIKAGVRQDKPQHFVQMQVYMGLMNLPAAIYLAVCKDDDRIHCERIEFDPNEFASIIERAKNIIDSKDAPERMSDNPTFWKCKFCAAYKHCHGDTLPKAGCRTCVYSTPVKGGKWHCKRHDEILSFDNQIEGCCKHLFIPGLVPAEPVSTTLDSVTYETPIGTTFTNGEGGWLSSELAGLSLSAIEGAPGKIRDMFDGTVVGCEE